MIRRWLVSPHLRPIALLASGSAFAQALGVLITPVITRLYLPSDYGAMAVYTSIVAIAAAVAGGRYESAVTLPPESEQGERDAIALVRVALTVAVAVSVLAFVVVAVATVSGRGASLETLGSWAYAIPVGVLVSAWSVTLSSYATRRRQYGAISRIAPLQKAVSAGVQLTGGYLKLGLSGLMLGALVTPFVGLGVLRKVYRGGVRATPESAWNWAGLRTVARQYADFPRISTWFALLNAFAWNIQAIVLAHYYSIADVGQYALASAMISLPTTLVLTGVSQVYLRECAARADDQAAAMRLAKQTLKALLTVSAPLFLALFLASKYLFGIVFGPDWITAGAIAVAMIPLAWARFLTTSLTTTFNVYRRQGVLLVWQAATLTLTLSGLTLGGRGGLGVVATTWLSSALAAPMYLLLLPLVIRVIRSGRSSGTDSV